MSAATDLYDVLQGFLWPYAWGVRRGSLGFGKAFGVYGEGSLKRISTVGKWPKRLAVASSPGVRQMGGEEDRVCGWRGGPYR
jgi:hypothetical protein